MEALTRIVADSLARHGLDRPVDPRRLEWSRWFRCDSPHSLLVVPSKPGIFAIAEEVMNLAASKDHIDKNQVETAALGERSSAASTEGISGSGPLGGAALQRCDSLPQRNAAASVELPQRRMLAVLQFSEDDDMAFTLDRMFTCVNPMRARFASGRCFLRFVVIEDQAQRRSICAALNQWMLTSAEKATGLTADFQSSVELATGHVGAGDSPAHADTTTNRAGTDAFVRPADTTDLVAQAPQPTLKSDVRSAPLHLDSGASKNLHCPHPLPSGF